MAFDTTQLIPLLPEIILLVGVSLVLVIDLMVTDKERTWPFMLTLFTLLAAGCTTVMLADGTTQVVFDGTYIRDPMSDILKASLLFLAVPVFIYAREGLMKSGQWRGEFMTLTLFAILGMMVMISSNGFISLYLGLELLSLCLYALVAFNRDSSKSAEAAMKYFILGALASGLLLYGISMLYGATGKLDFPSIAQAVVGKESDIVLVFGLVFVVIGLAFKFGAVPFHMWVPDVYDGATTPVTLLVGSLPKIAALGLAMRILVDGLGELQESWQMMLIILAVLSMALGNLVAIAQENIKRMLAYSTISHVGFIFLGILAGSDEGYRAAIFYVIAYAAMAAGAFGVLIALDRKGLEVDQLHQLKGLNEKHPWLAGTMLLLMFSMAGVPPTVGFFAKLFVLEAIVSVGLTWLALVAVFFSIIGAFYYIRVVKHVYFDKPTDDVEVEVGGAAQVMLAINGLAMLALGLFPAILMNLI
ncbi:NADH-quinone oxidoreductase subunit NuoN [Solemya velum gill symbiont]|uniref:NADH-quinone oxidoreductase subunit NuoN n=1 Tax=Solemya velum gill symbiont TaxID=2340 RepID=UPI000997C51A|nr:NADH-quinone oxidoreductase subunit NuoN [Solemya velum gill symbiont]OOY51520.1 NADH-quinone oxidoreductase subunit N [Solemya velum gill symbiont]OOY55462.1 NADH-quinone oxidoreductase subunit N [Solemya velum gill symbiont]OOY56748.1 NADH-quinone oxidoreductase subunit N [Solemya velum gill symbiont]OOY59926.1 NADH-quinone oxidoreductase subunit N [Solemya velum gill symbiont]OOY62248.1 NADH-quinone oxidoreductase subunit N [Solemya velum gill symbiont]